MTRKEKSLLETTLKEYYYQAGRAFAEYRNHSSKWNLQKSAECDGKARAISSIMRALGGYDDEIDKWMNDYYSAGAYEYRKEHPYQPGTTDYPDNEEDIPQF